MFHSFALCDHHALQKYACALLPPEVCPTNRGMHTPYYHTPYYHTPYYHTPYYHTPYYQRYAYVGHPTKSYRSDLPELCPSSTVRMISCISCLCGSVFGII